MDPHLDAPTADVMDQPMVGVRVDLKVELLAVSKAVLTAPKLAANLVVEMDSSTVVTKGFLMVVCSVDAKVVSMVVGLVGALAPR